MMNKIRFAAFFLLLFICFPSTIIGQTKISSDERQQLEQKFKALKTFRIADDGTVVYSYTDKAENDTTNTQVAQEPAKSDLKPTVKIKVLVNEDGEYVVKTEEPDSYLIEKEEKVYYPIDLSAPTEQIQKVEKEIVTPIPSKPIEVKQVVVESTPVETKTTPNPAKANPFAKQKDPTYKTLEEAAMAIDDLLHELRQEQEQQNNTRNKNSISRKASGGAADKNLRKDYSYDLSKEEETVKTESTSVPVVNYGDEPTYYVDGVQVSPEEYKKLKIKDVLSKKIKASKANPNGEWWVETRK